MNATNTIVLARKHIAASKANEESARICLADAVQAFDLGDFEFAKIRALKSLAYSVGIFHADYKRAEK